MKMKAYIAGVGMTRFGKHMDTTLKGLACEAIGEAISDAGIVAGAIEAAYMANAAGGVVQGQEMISGQVALREMGIGRIPVINLENACASSSTAFNQAAAMVSLGVYDIALVCGFEKLFHEDKRRTFAAFDGAVDTENPAGLSGTLQILAEKAGEEVDVENAGVTRSVFMDIYSLLAKSHMKKYGTTREQLAGVTVKNSFHGSLNPRAQFQQAMTLDEVLDSREIIDPLTLPMCSPIGFQAGTKLKETCLLANTPLTRHMRWQVSGPMTSAWPNCMTPLRHQKSLHMTISVFVKKGREVA
jgi:acetyl-CoA acetyltransferase